MLKRLAYTILFLIFVTGLLSAKATAGKKPGDGKLVRFIWVAQLQRDTTKKQKQEEDKKHIKEISRAKRQSKPEKIEELENTPKAKPKRERRPEGLDRPPEIPRRNGN